MTIRVAMVLPGLHREKRGAETAFESLAMALGRLDDVELTAFGSGEPPEGLPYDFVKVGVIDPQRLTRLPNIPPFRRPTTYQELLFIANLTRAYRRSKFDITMAVGFPFTNLFLAHLPRAATRPKHVFVTQNGDWPPRSNDSEFRFFRCDGLVCTNREYYDANREQWPSVEIPNGIDVDRFTPGPAERERLGLPADGPIVLMVSAMTAYKRVLEAIPAVARIPGANLVVAGDGELRDDVHALADELLPGRFQQARFGFDDMPAVYRSADAVLHMALFEPFGNVYIEAVACGGSLVAHRNSSTESILDGVDCELLDTEDSDAVTAALERAIARGSADAPAAFRERFDWATLARQYRAFFEEIRHPA